MANSADQKIIGELAARVSDAAADAENEKKRALWRAHTALRGTRPLLFVSPEGSWRELLPESALLCRDETLRELERELRMRLIRANLLADDVPVERAIPIPRAELPMFDGWGLTPLRISSGAERGAWRVESVVNSPADWKRLKKPDLIRYEAGARRKLEIWGEAVGGRLDVFLTGVTRFDFHLMHLYCDLRGMENMFTDLIEEPNMVLEAMEFFTESYLALIDECEREDLVSLNNDHTFHYTGGLGYTDDLPAPGYRPPARAADVWGAAEAQEFHLVSPEMHERFALSFERRLLARFGLNGYGCCDDLTRKLPGVLQIPNLRRVSVSPWANVARCAEQLGKRVIMSWKAQPAYLAHEVFDEALVEQFLETELLKGRDSIMEIVLRDTHTCRMQPERFTRFTLLCRKVIDRIYPQPEGGQPT